MLKKATCFAALLLMAACSSGSVSNDASKDQSSESAGQEQPVASNSDVEAYEQNETTLSGEQNNNDFANKLDDEDLVAALREGGHVIYIRHAKTNKDWGDQISPELDLEDCNTQRQLSDEGKVDAKEIGEGIKAAGIPVGNVISSEYCRAYNTADLAFGTYTKDSNLNFLPCVECTPEDYKQYAEHSNRAALFAGYCSGHCSRSHTGSTADEALQAMHYQALFEAMRGERSRAVELVKLPLFNRSTLLSGAIWDASQV